MLEMLEMRCERSRGADLIRAKVVQGPGKHGSCRVPRQERGQVRHEPAAEGGAAGLQQALQILLPHCLHSNRHDEQDLGRDLLYTHAMGASIE